MRFFVITQTCRSTTCLRAPQLPVQHVTAGCTQTSAGGVNLIEHMDIFLQISFSQISASMYLF